jgi:hypothetical protein
MGERRRCRQRNLASMGFNARFLKNGVRDSERNRKRSRGSGVRGLECDRSLNGDRGDEAISSFCESLDVPGIFRGVAKRLAQLVDCARQPTLKINACVGTPNFVLQLFPGDDLSWLGEQGHESTKRLALEFYSHPKFAEISGIDIDLKGSEGNQRMALKSGHNLVSLFALWYARIWRAVKHSGNHFIIRNLADDMQER